MYLKYCKIKDVKQPLRAHRFDAGIDFFIPNDVEDITIGPGQNMCIPSGIKVEVPEGYALIAFNKSGIASKRNLIVGAEVIDPGYSGEIHIDIHNIGNDAEQIKAGSKIVQFILVPVLHFQLIEEKEDNLYGGWSERGSGGFGSTGDK